jgi:CRP-like cAMP-binding protein
MLQDKSSNEIIPNKLFEGIKELHLNFDTIQNSFLNFKKGDVIYQKGDPANILYLITEGKIKLEIVNDDGSFSVVIKSKGDFWGTHAGINHIILATAYEDSVVCKVDINQLSSLTEAHPEIEKNIRKSFLVSINNEIDKTEEETNMNTRNTNEEKKSSTIDKFDKSGRIEFEDIHKLYENIPGETINSEAYDKKKNNEQNKTEDISEEIKEGSDIFENPPNKDYKYVHQLQTNEQPSKAENIISVNSLLMLLSEDINYSTKLVYSLLERIKENYEGTGLLINSIISENRTIKNYVDAIIDYFKEDNVLQLEIVSFNQTMDYILLKLAGYAESNEINIFRKYGEDALVEIDDDKFYITCLQILKRICRNISEDKKILVTVNKNSSNIEIEFKDDRFEIPSDLSGNIFKPLDSIENYKNEFGLVLANKILNDHKGKVLVSKSGKLELFSLTLPIFEEI